MLNILNIKINILKLIKIKFPMHKISFAKKCLVNKLIGYVKCFKWHTFEMP